MSFRFHDVGALGALREDSRVPVLFLVFDYRMYWLYLAPAIGADAECSLIWAHR